MARRAGHPADHEQQVTRRDILRIGVASGLGFSATTLTVLGRPSLSAAGGIYGAVLWCSIMPTLKFGTLTWLALLGRWLLSAPCITK